MEFLLHEERRYDLDKIHNGAADPESFQYVKCKDQHIFECYLQKVWLDTERKNRK